MRRTSPKLLFILIVCKLNIFELEFTKVIKRGELNEKVLNENRHRTDHWQIE